MKLRITFPVALTFLLTFAMTTFPVKGNPAVGLPAHPDFPLNQLLPLASADINTFWGQGFYSSRLHYTVPMMVPYTQPIATPCGTAQTGNAFYCSRSNSIYYDYNFMGQMYSQIGDYAAVSILAHEWGHLVQKQLGLTSGAAFTIQLELQADCFSGAYTQSAERRGLLDPGDLEEAGVSLFSAGDKIGTPWFAANAHGSAMRRMNAFLIGYNNGVQKCITG